GRDDLGAAMTLLDQLPQAPLAPAAPPPAPQTPPTRSRTKGDPRKGIWLGSADRGWIACAILLALAGAIFLYLAGFEFFRYGDPWSGAPALAAACVCIALIGRVWRRR
ncbi:MAG: hypothetical protein ABI632_13045, partial [Pseudolysinimonas sp.]